MNEIQDLKQKRFLFLKKLYYVTDRGRQNTICDYFEDVGEPLGFNQEESSDIANYLRSEGLLRFYTGDGGIGMEHQGVLEIEAALEFPDKPTEHFPASGTTNIINIARMDNSQIQQSGNQSQQSISITVPNPKQIEKLLTKLETEIDKISLQPDSKTDLISHIETVRAQMKAKNPDKSILNPVFNSILRILEGTTATSNATQLIELIKSL